MVAEAAPSSEDLVDALVREHLKRTGKVRGHPSFLPVPPSLLARPPAAPLRAPTRLES